METHVKINFTCSPQRSFRRSFCKLPARKGKYYIHNGKPLDKEQDKEQATLCEVKLFGVKIVIFLNGLPNLDMQCNWGIKSSQACTGRRFVFLRTKALCEKAAAATEVQILVCLILMKGKVKLASFVFCPLPVGLNFYFVMSHIELSIVVYLLSAFCLFVCLSLCT